LADFTTQIFDVSPYGILLRNQVLFICYVLDSLFQAPEVDISARATAMARNHKEVFFVLIFAKANSALLWPRIYILYFSRDFIKLDVNN